MSPHSDKRSLWVAGVVALICAGLVTTAHVLLRPRIETNIALERQARMAAMLERLPGLADLLADSKASALEAHLVDLATGEAVGGDPVGFDPVAAAQNPERSRALAPEADIARLGRVATEGVVYLVREGSGRLKLVILPFHGRGYQSLIRGLLALGPDLETVAALNIIEQAETPGLGTRIQSPEWQAQWPGHKLVDEGGALAITVVRGRAAAAYEVDAVTGATRSSLAVGKAVRFWLGREGYGPFLERLRKEEGAP